MSFQISGLKVTEFAALRGLSDAELAERGARRVTADHYPGFPCRVSLVDAQPGERLLLVNYEHLAVGTPYRSRYAIYVREDADEACPAVDEIPQALRIRLLSLRGFSAAGELLEADVAAGDALPGVIERMFTNPAVAYLHAHNAKPGCYAARIERA
ncbi:MAG TPA: DUF1203 domain-containing protein [Candidatus Dormibacteraeota bacterium]|nr:DUF1203 domain-containing protein [Candidatus Dormibacteraeota bacterium]